MHYVQAFIDRAVLDAIAAETQARRWIVASLTRPFAGAHTNRAGHIVQPTNAVILTIVDARITRPEENLDKDTQGHSSSQYSLCGASCDRPTPLTWQLSPFHWAVQLQNGCCLSM